MKIYTSLNDRLKSQYLAIAEIISDASAERMITRPAAGKWNIHDNIAHLAKYQITFIERINKILNEDVPHFERYKAEEDPEFEIFGKQSDDDLLKGLNEQRIRLTSLIYSLSDKDLQKTGVHKKFGHLNIIQWIEFFLLHEAHHLFTIFQLANDVDLNRKVLHEQF